jgi:hypothetical protein
MAWDSWMPGPYDGNLYFFSGCWKEFSLAENNSQNERERVDLKEGQIG